ncbi:MAG: glycosyltransferase family 39 protein [Myxococcales bacterium]|nr:glycosyltransferase family 39 protein [Myxococcales bacterium]
MSAAKNTKKKAKKPKPTEERTEAGTEAKPAAPAPRGPEGPSRAYLVRGGIVMVLGYGATFLLMANAEQIPHGPGIGILTALLGTFGLLDLLGLLRLTGDEKPFPLVGEGGWLRQEGEPLLMSPLVTVPVALVVFVALFASGGVPGLPIATIGALLFLLLSAIRRPPLLVFVVGTGLIFPFLGVYGLWDPWETHYGEVAREILARDDWVSLWWAQEDWFWSKPILIFWIESLSMGALGVDFHADANPLHPELAIRLPHFFLTMGALFAVYQLVSRTWSKRAGVIAACVLATMPHFFFLSHQAITDMPFVSNMTMAMAMLGLAVITDGEREITRFRLGPIAVSGRALLIGAISIVVVPQILYLASRNVTFLQGFPPFGWHADLFMSGSAGNNGIPGNSPVHNVEPYLSGAGAQPIAQALFWLCCFLGLLWLARSEKRVRSLLMFAFYFFCGLSFMAKGIPGFALPGLVALFFLMGTGRWELLKSGQLRVGGGILTVLTVGMPWYVAMFIRHGTAFTDRLLVHDHLNRLTSGVHMDETRAGSIGYFVEQMGYGMFPWIALAPLALAVWVARPPVSGPTTQARRDVTIMAVLWLAAAFTLFSAMTTKFHHYIFPAVPAAAILVGVVFDRMLRPHEGRLDGKRIAVTTLAMLSPLPVLLGVAGRWGDVRGIIPEGLTPEASADWVLGHPWPLMQTTLLILAGAVLLGGAWWIGRDPKPADRQRASWARGAMTTGLLAAPPILAIVGRDLSWVTDARPQGYERLIHLFVYNYGRPWPTELDYRPILTGFAIVTTLAIVLAAFRSLRDVALRAFLGTAMLFCVWSLDVYMIDLSPHWGQRELIQRYYDMRRSAEEPLVAWQMNWKGENFYSGNHVNVFVQLDNRALRDWLGENRGRTAYFLLEHSRLANLRNVMRDSTVEEVTDPRFCNKFILVRAHIGTPPTEVRDQRE